MKAILKPIIDRMCTGDIRGTDTQVFLMAIYKLLLEMQTTQQLILSELQKKEGKDGRRGSR